MATCGGCSAEWSAGSWAHCAAECHETFLSVAFFDDHRVNGECWGIKTVDKDRILRHTRLIKLNGTWGTRVGHEAFQRSQETLRIARQARGTKHEDSD